MSEKEACSEVSRGGSWPLAFTVGRLRAHGLALRACLWAFDCFGWVVGREEAPAMWLGLGRGSRGSVWVASGHVLVVFRLGFMLRP